MDEQQIGLPKEEIAFQRMREFHLQRVSAIAAGDGPLQQRNGGVLVLHLVPEICIFRHTSFDGNILTEYGTRIRPPGPRGGNNRFNVDGLLNFSGYEEVDAYSQLFRDGRLESAMSNVGYLTRPQSERGSFAIRCGVVENSVFEVVGDYLSFCRAVELQPPMWLFSALIDCKGFRMTTNRPFRDLAKTSIDRSPAVLPELKISQFDVDPRKQLQPWCDLLWQASGLAKSLNYDPEGNWHEPK